ncbi:BatD family protein [Elusimicrobiota bacterium]
MKHIILLILMLLPSRLHAGIEIESRLSRDVVPLNEQVELEITVSGSSKDIGAPKVSILDDFYIASSGRSSSISIINGNMTSSYIYSYVLSPKKTGDFVIPSFAVNYRGRTYKTEPIGLKVVEAQEQKFTSGREGRSERTVPELFVEQELDKKTAYTGEQVTYTFKFYRRVRLLNNPSFESPDFNGFIKEDLPPNRNYRTRVEGREYVVTDVKYGLFPVKSGTLNIPPARLMVAVEDFSAGDEFFSNFFSQGKRKTLATNNLTLKVLPLPAEGQPAGFSGAIGDFDLDIKLDKDSVMQGEPITLEVKISGKGDLRSVKQMELGGLNNFRVYETVDSVSISKKKYTVTGTKIFKTPLVPVVSGKLSIPGVKFSYFDPVRNKYVTKESSPVYLEVLPAPETERSAKGRAVSEELQVVREDIRYITAELGKRKTAPLYEKKYFWQIEGIPVYLWVLSLVTVFFRKKFIEPRYPRLVKNKVIRKCLKEAEKSSKKGNYMEVYKKIEEISNYLERSPEELQEVISRAKAGIYSPEKNKLDSAKDDLKKFARLLKKSLMVLLPAVFLLNAVVSDLDAATDITGTFSRANSLYKGGNFKEASLEYNKIIEEEGEYEGVLYNLGNAYWRLGSVGRARQYWEKSLKLNHFHKDAAYNVELVMKSIGEKKESDFLGNLSDKVFSAAGLNGMIVIATILGWGFLSSFLCYYFRRREVYIWIGTALAVLFCITAGAVWLRVEEKRKIREGIIIETTEIYNSPGTSGQSQGVIPAGKKIVIMKNQDGWTEVGIEEKNLKFWILEEKLGKI